MTEFQSSVNMRGLAEAAKVLSEARRNMRLAEHYYPNDEYTLWDAKHALWDAEDEYDDLYKAYTNPFGVDKYVR